MWVPSLIPNVHVARFSADAEGSFPTTITVRRHAIWMSKLPRRCPTRALFSNDVPVTWVAVMNGKPKRKEWLSCVEEMLLSFFLAGTGLCVPSFFIEG